MINTITSKLTSILTNRRRQCFKVALLAYDEYSLVERLHAGFSDTISFNPMQFPIPVAYAEFSARGSEDELYDVVKKNLCGQDYDLIFATGITCARVLQEFKDAKKISVPVVYAGIRSSELTEKDFAQSGLIGVISTKDSYKDRVTHMKNVSRDLNDAVVMFDDDEERLVNYATCTEIEAALREQNINARFYGITGGSDLEHALKQLVKMRSVRAFFSVHQTKVHAHMREISGVATSYRIPLFASDLSSVTNGAAIGCGTSDYRLGNSTGKIITSLLTESQEGQEKRSFYYVNNPLALSASPMNMRLQGLDLSAYERGWLDVYHVGEKEY